MRRYSISRRIRVVQIIVLAACLATNVFGTAQSSSAEQASSAIANDAGANGGYDAALFGALRWRNIGPNRGGRSIAAAGSSSRQLEYYFGAVGGGLWKTSDGGTTWAPVTDGQIRSSSVGAVAVSESTPDIVYIGMGEACLRGNIMQGDGVYKSTDSGKTWKHVGLADSQVIAKIRIHPANPDIVYAASFGHPAGSSDERGVFRSKDGGKTWQRVLFRNSRTGAIDLVIDNKNPNVLYAALWEAYRVSWQMSSGGPGSGLFKSTDGGDTWTEITRNHGMPQGVIGRIGVAVSGAGSNRVYAIVENENGGVFSSDDAGITWSRVSEDRRVRQRAFYYTHIYADPKNRETVYVLNTGFYKSTDGGKSYRQIRTPHGDNHDLWIDANNPQRMINSNDGGGNVSVNGGATWTGQEFPTAQLYHVATTKDFPYQVCGAQQDNSTICVPSQPPRGRTGAYVYAVGGGESGYIAPHPTNPNLFYAGSQGALITRFDRSNGQIRDIQPYPRFFSGEPSSALKERWQWTFPIVFSPHDARVLYISSQHLWKTTDDGQTWERISPDLTRAEPKTLGHSGGPITGDMNGPEIFATIFAIAPSRLDAGAIWTGSDDGLIYVTRDGGKKWTKVTPPELPDLARVSIIDASPHKAGTAYVAVKNYLQDDRAPYIFKTHDFGKTWTKIVRGIRAGDYVHAVREDTRRPGLLYAGTEHGMYVSFDDGENWQSLSLNLPDTQVSDIVVEQNDLVIATHGRSFYVMDDIGVLRQLTPEIAQSPAHLFQPRDVIRSVDQASFDYYLKAPAEKVTIEMLDAKGQVIRSFTGIREDEKKEEATSGTTEASGFGFGQGARRTRLTNAGVTRFTWDLRYEGSAVFPGMILWSANAAQGPIAAPGSYQVRLTAGDYKETRKFTVKIDPRLTGVTAADLQAQFDLAMKIRDKTSEANEAVALIRDVTKQAREQSDKAKDKQITAAVEALSKKLSEVEEEIYQVRNRSNQDPLNFPIKLNNRIASLRRSVETGDARPTNGAHQVFKELSAELDVQIEKLNRVIKADLVALNQLLKEKGLEPISGEVKKRP